MKVSASLAAAAVAAAVSGGAVGSPDASPKLSGEKLAELMQLSLTEIKNRMGIIFSMVDTNADGQITAEEAQAWSTRLKEAMHKHQVKQEFISIDKDNDGKITLEELEVTYTDGSDPASQEAHKAQDKDKDGSISLEEFLQNEGGTLTEPEREELTREFSSYDKDGDKKIDEAELRAVIQDPHAHDLQQMMETLKAEMEDGKITKDQWTDKFETFAVSMLTDNGELLRFPEEYEGIDLPFKGISAGPGEEDDLQHDEL